MILNSVDRLHAIDEVPELFEGTGGTMLGRCQGRDHLGWPPGPWDNEPDIIAWKFKAMLAMLARDHWGRWEAYLFNGKFYEGIALDAKLPRGMVTHSASLGIAGTVGFEYWGMHEFARGHSFGGLHIDISGGSPGGMPHDTPYVTAQEKLVGLGRLIKAAHIDPWLRHGTYLAASFDGARFDGPRFSMARRIDVEAIIAPSPLSTAADDKLRMGPPSTIQNVCPSLSCFKTWDNRVIALTNKNDECTLVDVTADPMAGLVRRAQYVEHKNAAAFLNEAERWFMQNGWPGKPVSIESIDAIMIKEMGLLDEVLR